MWGPRLPPCPPSVTSATSSLDKVGSRTRQDADPLWRSSEAPSTPHLPDTLHGVMILSPPPPKIGAPVLTNFPQSWANPLAALGRNIFTWETGRGQGLGILMASDPGGAEGQVRELASPLLFCVLPPSDKWQQSSRSREGLQLVALRSGQGAGTWREEHQQHHHYSDVFAGSTAAQEAC